MGRLLIAKSAQNPERTGIFGPSMCYNEHAAEEVAKTRLALAPAQREVTMLLKTIRAFCCLIALLAITLVALPQIASAQRGSGLVTQTMRDACRAQIRALGMRGPAGGNAERHRAALFQQCIRNRGRV
jgi:hypothetical protein